MRRVRMQGEEGIALTVAIMALALMITISGVALNQAVFAVHTSVKQANMKRALQAADSAIDSAAYGLSRLDVGSSFNIDARDPSAGLTQSCLVSTGEVAGLDLAGLDPLTPADPNGNKWCPENSGGSTEDGVTFTYRMSQLLRAGSGPCGSGSAINLDRDVVGVGRAGTATRRVRAHLQASLALLSGAAVQATSKDSPLKINSTTIPSVVGDASSNGAITGTGISTVTGKATPGYGKSASGVVAAGGTTAACDDFTIPEVNQADAPTTNSNSLQTKDCVSTSVLTLFTTIACVGSPTTYNASARTLDITSNGRVRLTGTNYSFCRITIKGNGVLQVPSNNPVVRLFMDDPNNCRDSGGNLIAGAGTISVSESGRIVNCHADTQPETLQIYAVGNTTLATTQTLSGSGLPSTLTRPTVCLGSVPSVLGEPMVIVAPHSQVTLSGSTAVSGQVAAGVVEMGGAASVRSVNALVNLNRLGGQPILPLYKPTDYVECTGRDFSRVPAANPSQGC